MYDLIVVGGGASGMIAAGRAAERGLNVLLLEKNRRLGEKLRISGGGRCNITNAEDNEHLLLSNYGKSEQSLYSLFTQFGMIQTFEFFESRGLTLKVEAKKRAFPITNDANDVAQVLIDYIKKGKVEVRPTCTVFDVQQENGAIAGLHTSDGEFVGSNYLFATGGVSHPETGSTGDGLHWLEELGHTVMKPTPTIVPIALNEEWIKTLQGVTLPNVRMTFYVDKIKDFRIDGDVLCTHFGVSGPLILNSAFKVADALKNGEVTALIDLFPKQDHGTLERQIIGRFDLNKNKDLRNVLRVIVPTGTHKGVVVLLAEHMNIDVKVHSFSRESRKQLVQLLKAMPVSIYGLMGMDRAVVADGGIPLQEIDMRTMRSKKVPNLYVTGDLLHINRPSGGFSLQLCWSSGWVAGSSVRMRRVV
jgi:predicted Rossmann fold flavoprotein